MYYKEIGGISYPTSRMSSIRYPHTTLVICMKCKKASWVNADYFSSMCLCGTMVRIATQDQYIDGTMVLEGAV